MEMKKLLDLQRVQLQSNEDDSDSCAYSSRGRTIIYVHKYFSFSKAVVMKNSFTLRW